MTEALTKVEIHDVGCGKHQYRCTCEAPAGHEHHHRCRCGGEWTGDHKTNDLVWHVRPGYADPSPLDPHYGSRFPQYSVDDAFTKFMRDYVEATYQQMMNTVLTEQPLFRYRPQPNYFIAAGDLKAGDLVKVTANGTVVNLTVDIIDPPDYGRLIKQCEPPKALQSGEVRGDRRD